MNSLSKWHVGSNLFTPYEQLVYDGAFDDVIGGEESRDLAVVEHDLETTRILEEYREVCAEPPSRFSFEECDVPF
jgi:hypothetical protein